jgi:hypothetical protein
MLFDGIDDYVDCGNVWNLSTSTWSPFTLSFWYKGTNPIVGAVHTVSLLKFAPSQFLGLYDGYTGAANLKLYFNFGGLNIGWTVGSNGTVDLFDDQWHNVAIVFPPGSNDGVDATNAQMYIDNTLMAKVGSGIISPPSVAQTWNTFQIMEGEWSPLGGLVDELALWKTDETSNVEAIYNGGTPTDLTPLNPIAWYRMGDNGAYKDPQWLIPSNENKDKVSNYSMEFDGLDDSVELGTQSLGITGSISVSAWVKIPISGVWPAPYVQEIFGEDGTSGINWNLTFRPPPFFNYFSFTVYHTNGTSTILTSSGVTPNDGQWHHLLATSDGTTNANGVKLYVDGILNVQATATSIGTKSTPTVIPTIGSTSNNSWFFEGNIDEVSIWDNVVSIGNVWDGSGKPIDITPTNPFAWWKMGENATFVYNVNPDGTWTIPDEVGTNDGTSNNLMADSARVGEAPGSVNNGVSSNMTIEDRIGESPNTTNNALSFNMDLIDRVEDTPPTP